MLILFIIILNVIHSIYLITLCFCMILFSPQLATCIYSTLPSRICGQYVSFLKNFKNIFIMQLIKSGGKVIYIVRKKNLFQLI